MTAVGGCAGSASRQGAEPEAVRQVREAVEALLREGRQEEAWDLVLSALAAVVRKSRDLELLVAKLRRQAVGRTSERLDLGQLSLFFEQLVEAMPEQVDAKAEEREDRELDERIQRAEEEQAKARQPQGRRRVERVRASVAEVQVHHHEVPPERRECTKCGLRMPKIGEDVSYELEYVPGHFVRHEHHQEKLACPTCKCGVTTAPGVDKVIQRSQAGTSLLAHVVVSKYVDHQPLHRLAGIYARSGVRIAVSTLSDWVGGTAEALSPLVEELEQRVKTAFVVRTDATGIKVLEREGGENVHRGTFWAYVMDDLDVVFRYAPTGEGASGPWEFLAGRTGYVQADAATVFERVFNGSVARAVELACWAHARRKLVELEGTDFRVAYPLRLIARMYRVEHLASAQGLVPAERASLRQELTLPILEKLRSWVAAMVRDEPPGSAFAKALGYMVNQWQALTRFVEDGRLTPDNNLCEQQMRTIALGRRNYLFCGSDKAARRAATLYSLTRTCALRGVPPLDYLTDVLARIAAGWPQARIAELLPDRWQPEAVPRPVAV